MKIAIGSDMIAPVTQSTIQYLQEKGHEITLFGALKPNETETAWSKVGEQVAQEVGNGHVENGILFCWTGTGVSIAANKVNGIRAALCGDQPTAEGAKQWNDANVLVMSIRATSEIVAKEILEGWFRATISNDQEDIDAIDYLKSIG
jgi:ribose 5-phosphate isomerase B